MKIAFFSATKTDKAQFNPLLAQYDVQVEYFEAHLSLKTLPLAEGFDGICVFVNDQVNAEVIRGLAQYGVKLVALRCAGFNNVDREAAKQTDMTILRVPAYSPMAVAEHALALMLSLNRKTYRAYNRVRDSNFTLEGLLGFDLFHKTAGVIGTGRIGQEMVRILNGIGMDVLAYDPYPTPKVTELGARYASLDELYAKADILSLHVPLLPDTHHLIDAEALKKMKDGVMLINTSRGALMDAEALIVGLKARKIGYLGIDVYEQEENLFFEDHSEEIIEDDVFERLVTFPNVLITAHQAFYTKEALNNIAHTTLQNIHGFAKGQINPNNCVMCEA